MISKVGYFSPPHIRSAVANAIDSLIGLLDAADGDADFEPEEDCDHDGREPLNYELRG